MSTMITDPKVQRKYALSAWLSAEGTKYFMADMEDQFEGAKAQLDNLIGDKINDSRLAELNFKIGFKAGLERVLSVIESFKEELESRKS